MKCYSAMILKIIFDCFVAFDNNYLKGQNTRLNKKAPNMNKFNSMSLLKIIKFYSEI